MERLHQAERGRQRERARKAHRGSATNSNSMSTNIRSWTNANVVRLDSFLLLSPPVRPPSLAWISSKSVIYSLVSAVLFFGTASSSPLTPRIRFQLQIILNCMMMNLHVLWSLLLLLLLCNRCWCAAAEYVAVSRFIEHGNDVIVYGVLCTRTPYASLCYVDLTVIVWNMGSVHTFGLDSWNGAKCRA